jgi:hypothetical protein
MMVALVHQRRRAGRLCQTVCLQDVEAQAVEVSPDFGVEPRSSGHHHPHPASDDGVDAAEEEAAEIDSDPAKPAIDVHQQPKQPPRHHAAFCHLRGDALVNQIEELRHARENRHAALFQRPQELCGVDRFEKDDAGANRQRQQQVGHLRQRVKERQDSEDAVGLRHAHDREGALPFRQQICVRQHDALRVARGARRVKDHRGVFRMCRTGEQRRRRHASAHHGIEADAVCVLAVQQNDTTVRCQGRERRRHGLEIFRRREHDAGARIAHERFDLRRLIGSVERHGDGTPAQDAKIGGAPMRVVVGKDRAAIARGDADDGQPGRGALRHLAEALVAETVEGVAALQLDGDVRRVARCGVSEQLVEVLHARRRRA